MHWTCRGARGVQFLIDCYARSDYSGMVIENCFDRCVGSAARAVFRGRFSAFGRMRFAIRCFSGVWRLFRFSTEIRRRLAENGADGFAKVCGAANAVRYCGIWRLFRFSTEICRRLVAPDADGFIKV